MWEPQLKSFRAEHRLIAPDLPGFGQMPLTEGPVDFRAFIRDALDAAEMRTAALVGTSLGGRIAIEVALESPQGVSALVLVGSGLDGHEWSNEVHAFGDEEEAALERGDLDAAVETNLRMWLAGPSRSLDDVDPTVHRLVGEMQRNAFELQHGHEFQLVALEPPASQRLDEIRVPTLVLTGDDDVPDIHAIAEKLAREIPGAERATISGTAHLPNLERPAEFDRIVLGFLRQHGV
jgi:3-oxoadipate enol-lactonase